MQPPVMRYPPPPTTCGFVELPPSIHRSNHVLTEYNQRFFENIVIIHLLFFLFRCELNTITEALRYGWPTQITVTIRDQYGDAIVVPELKVSWTYTCSYGEFFQ